MGINYRRCPEKIILILNAQMKICSIFEKPYYLKRLKQRFFLQKYKKVNRQEK